MDALKEEIKKVLCEERCSQLLHKLKPLMTEAGYTRFEIMDRHCGSIFLVVEEDVRNGAWPAHWDICRKAGFAVSCGSTYRSQLPQYAQCLVGRYDLT